MTIALCIGCGCADDFACWDDSTDAPCHWAVVDRHAGLGVCSCCSDHLPRWQAGDHTLAPEALNLSGVMNRGIRQ
jgi:hypothetical protein